MRDKKSKKIGGEFEISPFELEGYENMNIDSSPIVFSSGRSALTAILQHIRAKDVNEIYVPHYICPSVVQACKNAFFEVRFYEPDQQFKFPLELLNSMALNSSFLSVNYFGLVDDNNVVREIQIRRPDVISISDNVQSYWTCHLSVADFSFTSLRKHMAVPDGAIVYKKGKLWKPNIDIPANSFYSHKLIGAILKGSGVGDQLFLKFLRNGEHAIDSESICTAASNVSKHIFQNIEFERVKNIRKENYKYIYQEGNNIGLKFIFSFDQNQIPLCVPILINNRDAVRAMLSDEKIYLPVHWPISSFNKNSAIAKKMAAQELSLIIDQRYSEIQLEKVLTLLKNI